MNGCGRLAECGSCVYSQPNREAEPEAEPFRMRGHHLELGYWRAKSEDDAADIALAQVHSYLALAQFGNPEDQAYANDVLSGGTAAFLAATTKCARQYVRLAPHDPVMLTTLPDGLCDAANPGTHCAGDHQDALVLGLFLLAYDWLGLDFNKLNIATDDDGTLVSVTTTKAVIARVIPAIGYFESHIVGSP